MSNSWDTVPLGEVIELKRGYDLPQQERRIGDIPIVSSSGITDYHDKAMVKGPGVVTGRYGTLGQVFYIGKDFWPLNTTLYVRDFKGNDPRFISYFLRCVDFMAYSDKAAVPGLNRNHLHTAQVKFPRDISEQRAIAHVLEVLDEKIDINRRMNETLEEIVRAVFRNWFVEFGPVRAKMNESWKRAESLLGTPAKFFDLFPDHLDDQDLPFGWRMNRLSDWGRIVTGKTPSTARAENFGTGLPFITPTDMKGGVFLIRTGRSLSAAGVAEVKSCVLDVDSLLVSCIGSDMGKVAIACCPALTNQQINSIVPTDPNYLPYLYCNLSARKEELMALAGGSAQPILSKQAFSMVELLKPSDKVLQAFQNTVQPLFARIKSNAEEILLLAELRDSLLPKIISGEIGLKNRSTGLGGRS